MKHTNTTIGFGGSCHWCTEAIFLSLKGLVEVEQGWIAPNVANGPDAPDQSFSEAVLVQFDPEIISLDVLIAVHLATHSCTSNHSMRAKYRSAIYTFTDEQAVAANESIRVLQGEYEDKIITAVLPFQSFRLNKEEYLNYYYSDPEKPFCKNFITPKLQQLMERYSHLLRS